MRFFARFVGALVALSGVLIIVGAPLLTVWFGSSLIAFHGGPRWVALIGGALLFPVLPLYWEARATKKWRERLARRRQLGVPPRRKPSLFYRFVLRTMALSLVFLGVLMAWFPKVAFTALATRGDWFLEGRSGQTTQLARRALFSMASGLEWLHTAANPNPYRLEEGDSPPVPAKVAPTPEVPTGALADKGEAPPPPQDDDPSPVAPTHDDVPPRPQVTLPEGAVWAVGDTYWPHPEEVDPIVAAMSPEDETSIEAVARHIAEQRRNPFERVKALHDWLVTRLSYDHASLEPGQRKAQDPQAVFARRTAVCEGYARLFAELGKHTGDQIAYVVGDVRESNGAMAPVGHAWNAVEIDGQWYLVDVTWDDPTSLDGGGDNYVTSYLFIPPSIAVLDHFPEDERWQLLEQPLSRGDFLRQPQARPGLAKAGLTLTSPDRSVIEVNDAVEFALLNPRRLNVLVTLAAHGATDDGTECGVSSDAEVRIRCAVPRQGRYEARVFTNKDRYGRYRSAAAVQVVRP